MYGWLSRIPCALLVSALTAFLPLPARAADRSLARGWEGAWVLLKVESYSGCRSFYTDNKVHGTRVTSKGDHRFAPGELAKVDKARFKGDRADLLLTVAEPLLEPYRDGPFTLYRERGCKLELLIDLPGGRAVSAVDRALAEVAESFPGIAEARRSPAWNGRKREPYPPDYEATLAAHASWKASQVNAAVSAQLDEAIDEASHSVEGVGSDPDYLDGFARGVDHARDVYFGGCDSLVGRSVGSWVSSTPRGHSRRWSDGYRDGQRVAVGLELARRLRSCFVPVPPPPPPP